MWEKRLSFLPEEGKQMEITDETKDIVEKDFVAFPDITADVINVLLYQGKHN